jgi:hypothetical protein
MMGFANVEPWGQTSRLLLADVVVTGNDLGFSVVKNTVAQSKPKFWQPRVCYFHGSPSLVRDGATCVVVF